jgi:hypothetical protein
LRVALVSEAYPPETNRAARTLWGLTAELVRRGYDVLLLLPSHPAGRRGRPGEPLTKCVQPVAVPLYPEVRLALLLPGSVATALRHFHPDVVYLAAEGPLGLAALQAARRLALPCVSSYHANYPMHLGAGRCGELVDSAWQYLRWFHNRTRGPAECVRPGVTGLRVD